MGEKADTQGIVTFEEWLAANRNTTFRIWVLRPDAVLVDRERRIAAGEICNGGDGDTSPYESEFCEYVRIAEVVAMPNGDFLVGTFDADSDEGMSRYVDYHMLSRIRLAMCDGDQDGTEEE